MRNTIVKKKNLHGLEYIMLKYVILTDYIQNFLAFQGAMFSSSKDKADSQPRQYF